MMAKVCAERSAGSIDQRPDQCRLHSTLYLRHCWRFGLVRFDLAPGYRNEPIQHRNPARHYCSRTGRRVCRASRLRHDRMEIDRHQSQGLRRIVQRPEGTGRHLSASARREPGRQRFARPGTRPVAVFAGLPADRPIMLPDKLPKNDVFAEDLDPVQGNPGRPHVGRNQSDAGLSRHQPQADHQRRPANSISTVPVMPWGTRLNQSPPEPDTARRIRSFTVPAGPTGIAPTTITSLPA